MTNKNTNSKEQEPISRDQFTVVLEQINSKIDLLVEGYQIHDSKIDLLVKGYQAHDKRFDTLETELRNFKFDTESNFKRLEDRFESFKLDTESNFKSVADYLARIEAELYEQRQSQVNKEEFFSLEKRVVRIEQILPDIRLSGAKA